MDYVAVGRRIRAQRKKLSLSQEELAEMVNISTVHMSHIETGYTKLSLPVLVDLACALGVRTDDLIFDKESLAREELLEEITLELRDCPKNQLLTLRQILSRSKDAIQKYRVNGTSSPHFSFQRPPPPQMKAFIMLVQR